MLWPATGRRLLLAFLFGVTLLTAALLSFSIHSTRQIPSVRHRRRMLPIAVVALAIFTAVSLLSFRSEPQTAARPQQIVIRPTGRRVAFQNQAFGSADQDFDSRHSTGPALSQKQSERRGLPRSLAPGPRFL